MGWFRGVGCDEEGPGDNSVTAVVVQAGAEELELGLRAGVGDGLTHPPVGRGDKQLWKDRQLPHLATKKAVN